MKRIIRRSGAILTALTLVCVLGGAAAFAEDRSHDDRGRSARGHEQHRAPAYHRSGARYGYDQPSYGYGTPPIVYAPPASSGGINLIIPFRFR
jgi:hypothetical protein